jgi:hypothetical protein
MVKVFEIFFTDRLGHCVTVSESPQEILRWRIVCSGCTPCTAKLSDQFDRSSTNACGAWGGDPRAPAWNYSPRCAESCLENPRGAWGSSSYALHDLGFPQHRFALVRSTFDLAAAFAQADATGARRDLVQQLTRVDLLVLEDFGMKKFGSNAAEDLLEVFVRRDETASTLMTTSRPTQDWGVFLGDVPAATAILDRFLAHATIIQMTGKGYRLRQRATAADD